MTKRYNTPYAEQCVYLLTWLLLTGGICGCGRPVERVPDRTDKHADHLDEEGELPSLAAQWSGHLKLLQNKEQHEKFKKSILNLQKEAKKQMLTMVEAVPEGKPRREFLEDLSSFAPEKLKSLLNILSLPI